MEKENYTLALDLYALPMAQTYYKSNMKDQESVFNVFFRKNPFDGGYAITNGLDNIIDHIKNFKFTDEDITFLSGLGLFCEDFLNYLRELKFTGDIYAIPAGTPIFPNEPAITVKAPIIEAQIIEAAILSYFNHGTLITTATKRITNEATEAPVMEFGLRRGPGLHGATEASKYAYMGGCVGTSNVYAGKKYGIPVMGTMAHALVTAFPSEYEAFLAYAKANPTNCTFLVDTYDTLKSGIPNAIRVAKEFLIPNGYPFKGIRIDSGDLSYLSKEARKMLDEAGFPDTAICLSNGLNEHTIKTLKKENAFLNSIGVGDNIAAPKERNNGVYKLVAIEKYGELDPRIKVSGDVIKTTNPGHQKVYRFFNKTTGMALGDVIVLANEIIPTDTYDVFNEKTLEKETTLTNYIAKELQVPIFEAGKFVYQEPTIKEVKTYCEEQFKTIPVGVREIEKPDNYNTYLSIELLKLKKRLIEEHRNQLVVEPVKTYK